MKAGDAPAPTVLPETIDLRRALIFDAHASQEAAASRWLRQLARWIADGSFRPMPIRVLPRGLASVPDGLDLLRRNAVSGTKLVYRVADTPGLA